MMSPRTFSLLLAMTPRVGTKSLIAVLSRNEMLSRTPEEFLSLSPEAMIEEYGLKKAAAANLTQDPAGLLKSTAETEARLSALGVLWITGADAHYPELVEAMDPTPPGVLFLFGNTKLLGGQTRCVLSSRNSQAADLDLVEKLTEEAVLRSDVLVTGHNSRAYERSAVVPLRWGSPRILCLDRGLFTVLGDELKQEAFRAARLWRYEFDPNTDLVISPFRPEAGFVGVTNQVRDRLIGCLSRHLEFVKIEPAGNMDKIARMALKAGRGVRVSDRTPNWRQYVSLGAEVIPT